MIPLADAQIELLLFFDGQGGFAVFEADDAAPMMKDIAIWAAMFHFEVYPVLDVLDSTALQQQAVDFRDSIS